MKVKFDVPSLGSVFSALCVGLLLVACDDKAPAIPTPSAQGDDALQGQWVAEMSLGPLPEGKDVVLFLLENSELALLHVDRASGKFQVEERGNYHVATEDGERKLVMTSDRTRGESLPFYLCPCGQSLTLTGGLVFTRVSGLTEAREHFDELVADSGDLEGPSEGDMRRAQAKSQNHMKQIGIVLKMVANESRGQRYPPLSATPGELMFQADKVYPEYLTDPAILINPQAPDAEQWQKRVEEEPMSVLSDQHYIYLGYAISDVETAKAFFDAYEAAVKNGDPVPDADLPLPTVIGVSDTIFRMREGIERFFITDINDPAASVHMQASLPV